MSLIELSKASPESFEDYLARQIVAFAGDGHLKDNSPCSEQFRAYLRASGRNRLERYAQECLEQPFTDSGLVLQDIVNELGRRLEFVVENGRYRGIPNAIGFDGIWRVPNGPAIIVEVKTTDTYNVSLESVSEYRNRLIANNLADKDASVLFVVGRKDTGALEAQIRGSRHAWDMRVVGVESLIKLVTVKEKSSEDQTISQIRELLRPFEYTRVDRILDVVFSATIDAVNDDQEVVISDPDLESETALQARTPQQIIEDIRLRAVQALNHRFGVNLVRRRQALFEDADENVRACATISKRYDDKAQPYWYAYHPKWDEFLEAADNGYVVFGCVDRSEAFAIPLDRMRVLLPSLNKTVRPDGTAYWHVKFIDEATGIKLFASKTGEKFDLAEYRIELPE